MTKRQLIRCFQCNGLNITSVPTTIAGTLEIGERLFCSDCDLWFSKEQAKIEFAPFYTEGKKILKNEETVLEEAQRLVGGDRQQDYGSPYDDFTAQALVVTAILQKAGLLPAGVEVPGRLMPLIMVGLKVIREANKPKRDNIVDGPGYFRCLEIYYSEEEERNVRAGTNS